MILPAWLSNMDRKRLLMAAGSAVLLIVILILSIAIPAGTRSGSGTPRVKTVPPKATQRGGALAGELLFPGQNPHEPEFPFVRERKSRYTFEDIKKLLPDPAGIDVDSLRKKRKERLETLYSALD